MFFDFYCYYLITFIYLLSRFGYSIFASFNKASSFFVCSIKESHSSPIDESACSKK